MLQRVLLDVASFSRMGGR